MTINEAIYSKLSGDAGVSALVSSRIYPVKIPENATVPALAFGVVTTERFSSLDGPTGVERVDVQVDCIAASLDLTRQLGAAVLSAMDGIAGTYGSISVLGAWLHDEAELYDEELMLFDLLQTYSVTFGS